MPTVAIVRAATNGRVDQFEVQGEDEMKLLRRILSPVSREAPKAQEAPRVTTRYRDISRTIHSAKHRQLAKEIGWKPKGRVV